MNETIYCISGLGADEKVFSRLRLNGHDIRYVPWLRPQKNEKIDHYAKRMAESIQHDSPVILGVSFGGMIGIEIAKQLQLRKLFIISSIKSTRELPGWMKVAGTLQLNKMIPMRPYKFIEKIDNDRLGVSNEEERKIVQAYRRSADPVYLDWAINEVLNWKNDWQPENIIHIHGDKDRIFPIKNLNAHHIIEDGTHFMIYNRAEEISKIIDQSI